MIGNEEDDQGENHQVRVEKQEDAGVVEAPFASEAPAGLGHSPTGDQQDQPLPRRAVQILDVRKARQQQASDEGAQGEHNAAHE